MSKLSTAMEWYRCMMDPEYAKTSSLRITKEAEKRALRTMEVIIVVLVIATSLMWIECYRRFNRLIESNLMEVKVQSY